VKKQLERTTFETSRAAEYFDARDLAAQTGQPKENFATVALKELVDNALDACETAGVAPEIEIGVREESGIIHLAVADNGGGIPPETIRRVLNYETRTSDKAAYRSPTRGAQGNALKTVLGIPHALGSEEPVIIEAQEVRHEIRAWVDPAGELRIEHEEEKAARIRNGTRIVLAIPAEGQKFDPGYWVSSFSTFNPHATFKFECLGGSYRGNGSGTKTAEIYKSSEATSFSGSGWRKFLPQDLTSPHWYDVGAIKRLVFSHVADARRGGRDVPLGEFVRQFRGLSSSAKAKTVCSTLPNIKRLSDFEGDPEKAGALLAAMQANSKVPSQAVLGVVGEEHFHTSFEAAYDVREFTYKKAKGHFPSGLPFTFEFALAVTDMPGRLYCGINFSPSFGDPLEGTRIAGPKFEAHGIRGFLLQGHALPDAGAWYEAPADVVVSAHIITPAPVFLDRGKTRLQIEEVSQDD
jgi:DNA topoisomerase VI subunit B